LVMAIPVDALKKMIDTCMRNDNDELD
jgi:hypothetical protein